MKPSNGSTKHSQEQNGSELDRCFLSGSGNGNAGEEFQIEPLQDHVIVIHLAYSDKQLAKIISARHDETDFLEWDVEEHSIFNQSP